MAERIRFHLDEHMDPDIASGLRRFGIDVSTTVEQRMMGQSDESHLLLTTQQGRVMVTDDTDFLIAASKSTDHPGIVFCRRTSHTMGEIIRFLILLHEVYTPSEMEGRVEYLA